MEISLSTFANALTFLGNVSATATLICDQGDVTWVGVITPTNGIVRYRLGDVPIPASGITIDVRAFGEYARALAGGMRTQHEGAVLSRGEGGLELVTGSSHARIGFAPGSPLPAASADDAAPIEVDARALRRALEGVINATERTGARPALECVLLDVEGDGHQLVAADGYRLAVARLEAAGVAPMLIHWRDAQLWARWLKGRDGAATLRVNGKYAQLGDEAWQLVARSRVDLKFPNYRAIIPVDMLASAQLPLRAIKQLVAAAAALADKDAPGVTLAMGAGALTLITPNVERGRAELRAEAQTVGEGTATLAARYLREALAAVDDADVEVALGAAGQPVRVRGLTSGIAHYIMPMMR